MTCTAILVEGKIDQIVEHQGRWEVIVRREVKDLKAMDCGKVTTKVFGDEAEAYDWEEARG